MAITIANRNGNRIERLPLMDDLLAPANDFSVDFLSVSSLFSFST